MTIINDLPDEILEFIFSHMPPYKDLESCSVVCKRWNEIIKNVRRHTAMNFNKGLVDFRLCWDSLNHITAPTISGRFSHSAIVHENSMYIFGGGSSTATTFNDLWRFDLSNRQWIHPISMGTYPSPKACATMVSHNNCLILFGGWRHPSTFPPYQPWRLFDELHCYNIHENKWLALTTLDGPPPMTGHSATVHKNVMIVFGGYSQNDGQASSSNDVWALDLLNFTWSKKETTNAKPAARYGQFQIVLDNEHCLILGGCGGPNNMFTDAWILDMSKDLWSWKLVTIKNKKWAATHMWCNPACKVGNKLVILGPVASASSDFQMVRHQMLPSTNRNNFPRINQPIAQQHPNIRRVALNNNNIPASISRNIIGENGNRRTVDERNRNVRPINANDQDPMRQSAANNAEDNAINRLQRNLQLRSRRHENEDMVLPKRFGEPSTPSHDRIAMAAFNVSEEVPSNSTSPRERRLQSLRRMEEKIQAMRQMHQPPEQADEFSAPNKRIKRNCIGMFICDIANVLQTDDPFLEWIEHKNFGHISNAPERLILSSLVTGNGELIMFGGLRKESLSKSTDTTMQVSNAMHFLRVPREII